MPLAGTPREQKHYREIREEYPEKGKEYAARVARNIVRANTPGGRKLKGTTEYGRNWGPPYSEPLSKKGAFYGEGVRHALTALGLEKQAGTISKALLWPFMKMGPKAGSGFLGTAPFLAPAGALAGGVTGAVAGDEEHRLRNALLGALAGGGLGGLAAGTHGAVRHHLSKVPSKLPSPMSPGGSIINPEAEPIRKRIFREAAGVAGLGGVGGGLLAAKEGSDKTANWREALLNTLKSRQYGEFVTRMPIQMATGGALGALTGSLSDQPIKGMGIGMLGGLTSGFSVAAAPRLREMLIKRMQQGVR